jgi:hypothetical protein
VVGEQCIKYRFRDQVLRQHLDNLSVGNAVVQIVAEFVREGGESLSFAKVLLVFKNRFDAGDVGPSDLRDVGCPIFPVGAASALFDDLGKDRS